MTQPGQTDEREQLLREARAAYGARRWTDSLALLDRAGAAGALAAEDFERSGFAGHLVGDPDRATRDLERAHQAFLDAGDAPRAVRVAFWLALTFVQAGEMARAGGWFGRANRLLEHHGDCAERGFLLLPTGLQALGEGTPDVALARFAEACAIGERFGEPDLLLLGRLGTGEALVMSGRVPEGVALLDEVMVAVTADRVTPLVVGIAYCAAIETCQSILDTRRAQEWTAALSRWCEDQPDLVPFRGQCLTFRTEQLRLHGQWSEAMREAQRAKDALSRPPTHPSLGAALYLEGELHRLRGEYAEAEAAYREATRWGRPPEPGLALLRLAQGRVGAAVASVRRILVEARDPATRCRLLPAAVEVLLAGGDLEGARAAADELGRLAAQTGAPVLQSAASQAAGAVLLAEGDAVRALTDLRDAQRGWRELGIPYELAVTRGLISRALHTLGDHDAAAIEAEAARAGFVELGAAVPQDTAARTDAAGLSERELEVLRLVAAGLTNRAIATQLVISEKTVARHVSNIFAKLDVPSRAAATAFAFRQGLIADPSRDA